MAAHMIASAAWSKLPRDLLRSAASASPQSAARGALLEHLQQPRQKTRVQDKLAF